MSNVRQYSNKQLLERVESIGGQIPNIGKYLIIGVQSNEDEFNVFDDKFYVFDGPEFKQLSFGTTNPGKEALLFFSNYKLKGSAIWKTNLWYGDLYTRGYHKRHRSGGGMRALVQRKPVYFYRDSNKNRNSEERGQLYHQIIGLNLHGVDYDPYSNIIMNYIDKWSFGCQVWNRMSDYRQMINAVWHRDVPVDYALLKEF